MPKRIKRDRVKHHCPNCDAVAYAKPSNKLICGHCNVTMLQHIPDGYPSSVDGPEDRFFKRDPDFIPIAELALPPRVQELLAAPQKRHQGESPHKPALPAEALDMADTIILAAITAENEGRRNHGWKTKLANTIGRDPAWVTKRIKFVRSAAIAA